MKLLIEEISTVCQIDKSKTKAFAEVMARFIAAKIYRGEPIHLGCISVIPKKKKATVVKSHLEKTGRALFYMGDQIKWAVVVSKGWQRETKPDWSKYS